METQEQIREQTNATIEQAHIEMQKVALASYYEFFIIKMGTNHFWAKTFPQSFGNHYQKEKDTLASLKHSHIIRAIQENALEYIKASELINNRFLLFPYAQHRDLLKYVQRYGPFSQKVSSYYANQVISALSYAKENNVQHPNLHAQSLVMHQNRDIVFCGWSNSLNKHEENLENVLLSLGQIILFFCTSRAAFVSKDLRNDPYGKFLKESHIHKFWSQFEKALAKISKEIKLSPLLKQFLSNLFLKKIKSYEELLKSKWLSQKASNEDLGIFLRNLQDKYAQKKQERQNNIRNQQNQQKQFIKMNLIADKTTRSQSYFYQEYEHIQPAHIDIQEKTASDKNKYIILFDDSPKMIISHLRAKLRQMQAESQGQNECFVDPLLILKESQVNIQSSTLKINATFGWNYSLLEDKSEIYPCLQYFAEFHLKKDGDHLVGYLQGNQGNELNAICMNRFNEWIVNELSFHPSTI